MARDQGSETHTTKGATNVEKWDTLRTSANRRKEIKRRETKGRKRDRKITRGRRGRNSYLDSSASNHMTLDRHRFVDFTPATRQIRIGKGHLEVKGKGTIVVKMAEFCGGWTLSLSNALQVPQLHVNLISIRQLAKKGPQ